MAHDIDDRVDLFLRSPEASDFTAARTMCTEAATVRQNAEPVLTEPRTRDTAPEPDGPDRRGS